jgi:hypothetical protein
MVANLGLCLALTVLALRVLVCATPVAIGTFVIEVTSDRSVLFTSKCRTLSEGAIATYFNVL